VGPTDRVRRAKLGEIMHAKTGDWLIVETSTTDHHSVRGRIEEVLSKDGEPPYRVRWTSDDHISVVFPGPDARVVTAEELRIMDQEQAKRFTGGHGATTGNSTASR
jgi:hypothetical protein